ncbi:hypothetical protein BU17DRAFT_62696 [Hysterangium stoloniferum]|nr:hypothetical protein BU17DRAFT_62696 [Hysterangium stoloniferum]
MSQDSSIIGSLCACCSLFLFSAFGPWCNTKRYGCGSCSCSGPRGCCDACFAKGFNEDAWDREDAQRRAAEGEGEGEGGAGHDITKHGGAKRAGGEQPAPVADMRVAPAAGHAGAAAAAPPDHRTEDGADGAGQ